MARDTGPEDGAKGTAEEVRGRIKEAVAGLTGDCEVIAPVGAPITALRWRSSPLPFITGLGLVPPLASAVATALPSALDVLDVHEVTANRADMGLGAVQPTGDHTVRESTAKSLGVDHGESEEKLGKEQTDLTRMLEQLRVEHQPMPVNGRTAVVVDDGC